MGCVKDHAIMASVWKMIENFDIYAVVIMLFLIISKKAQVCLLAGVCDTPLTSYLILQKCCVLILSVF